MVLTVFVESMMLLMMLHWVMSVLNTFEWKLFKQIDLAFWLNQDICDWLFFLLMRFLRPPHTFSSQPNSFDHPPHTRQKYHSYTQPRNTLAPMSQPNEPAAHGSMKPVQVKLVLLGNETSVLPPSEFCSKKNIA